MNLVKVYDANGKHVDSFLKDVKKESFRSGSEPTHARKIKILSLKGFFVRRQFSKSGKTLVRSYA